jgi:hypothetical protein
MNSCVDLDDVLICCVEYIHIRVEETKSLQLIRCTEKLKIFICEHIYI